MPFLSGLTRWRGKTALITGASSGIGVTIAEALADAGLNLVLAARRVDRLEALKDKLTAQGVQVWPMACDLRDEAQILALFQRIKSEVGGLDVLVNNAGLGRRQQLRDGETQSWRDILEVNVLGLSICTREALPLLDGKADAAIINLSSTAAWIVPKGRGAGMYSASKYAVRSLTEGLRAELVLEHSSIKLAAISPGIVDTEFHEQAARGGTVQVDDSAFKSLEGADVADAILYVLAAGPNVQVNEIVLRPIEQLI